MTQHTENQTPDGDHSSRAMTAAERIELGKLVRLRAKVAKDSVEQIAARMIADSEAQLSVRFDMYDANWKDLVEDAEAVVQQADQKIAQRCRELGIPETFRPRLDIYWQSRGENAMKDRRSELRMGVRTDIEARIKEAKVEIDRQSAEVLTQLAAGALGSDEAKAFLANMPSIEALMPPLQFEDNLLTAKKPLQLVRRQA